MSSHPWENTVEAYISEAWYNITKKQAEFIQKVYTKNIELKEYIERSMSDFNEEEQSWRDYRNAIANNVDESYPNEALLIDYYIKFWEL